MTARMILQISLFGRKKNQLATVVLQTVQRATVFAFRRLRAAQAQNWGDEIMRALKRARFDSSVRKRRLAPRKRRGRDAYLAVKGMMKVL